MTNPVLDRAEIHQLIESWGILRDARRWEALEATFAPGAIMHTSAISGTAEAWLENAKRGAADGGTQHLTAGSYIQIKADRALAESRMIVAAKRSVDGVDVDQVAVARMFDRLVRTSAGWRILERFPFYEKSRVSPIEGAAQLTIDLKPFLALPEGLRAVAFVQTANGRDIPAGLLEKYADFDAVYAGWLAWLDGE